MDQTSGLGFSICSWGHLDVVDDAGDDNGRDVDYIHQVVIPVGFQEFLGCDKSIDKQKRDVEEYSGQQVH